MANGAGTAHLSHATLHADSLHNCSCGSATGDRGRVFPKGGEGGEQPAASGVKRRDRRGRRRQETRQRARRPISVKSNQILGKLASPGDKTTRVALCVWMRLIVSGERHVRPAVWQVFARCRLGGVGVPRVMDAVESNLKCLGQWQQSWSESRGSARMGGGFSACHAVGWGS